MICLGIYLVNFVSGNKAVNTNSSIVLYDAHCNFCSAIVRYFKKKDKKNVILWIENDNKKLNENIELQILSILIMKSLKLYWEICLLNIVLKFNFLRLIPLGYTEDKPRTPTQKPLNPK